MTFFGYADFSGIRSLNVKLSVDSFDIAHQHLAVFSRQVKRLAGGYFRNGIPLDLYFAREFGFQGESLAIRIDDAACQSVAILQNDLVSEKLRAEEHHDAHNKQ